MVTDEGRCYTRIFYLRKAQVDVDCMLFLQIRGVDSVFTLNISV